jgi:hypothetical protein
MNANPDAGAAPTTSVAAAVTNDKAVFKAGIAKLKDCITVSTRPNSP